MITQYLKAIDRDLYNRYMDFNLPYLNELRMALLVPMPQDIYVSNILAKDEMDSFKVESKNASKNLHAALGKLLDQTYFYNEEEKSVVNGLLTYLQQSLNPNLEHVMNRLAPLQEIHQELTDMEFGVDALPMFSKFLYNRSRMMALQSRGLNSTERELHTNLDQSLPKIEEVAAMLARINNIHNALKSIRQSVIPNMKDRDVCGMINDIADAMLSYRRSLIAPEKAGLGDVDLAASQALLLQKQPTQAAGDNLINVITKYKNMNLPFTPADFLLSLNEGVRLSGVNLMV